MASSTNDGSATFQSLSEAFASSNLSIVPPEDKSSSSSFKNGDNKADCSNIATTFYCDKSGRVVTPVKLRLHCPESEHNDGPLSKEQLIKELYGIAACQPSEQKKHGTTFDENANISEEKEDNPQPWSKKDETNQNNEEEEEETAIHSLKFECQSKDEQLIVEGVTLLSSSKNQSDGYLEMDVEIMACASSAPQSTSVISQLEIRAVLSESTNGSTSVMRHNAQDTTTSSGGNADPNSSSYSADDAILNNVSLGLLALEIGGGMNGYNNGCDNHPPSFDHHHTSNRRRQDHYGSLVTHTPPIPFNLRFVHPLTISTASVGGARAAVGATFVSLTVSHSNQHSLPVRIIDIALHPGHSRALHHNGRNHHHYNNHPYASSSSQKNTAAAAAAPVASDGRSMLGGDTAVIDMSRHVRWGYAKGTELNFPTVLYPHEAYSTVIQIDAGEDLRSRTFVSPVAVTCCVLEHDDDDEDVDRIANLSPIHEDHKNNEEEEDDDDCDDLLYKTLTVMTDVKWSTERVAVVPADAFRVDMSLREDRYKVGAPLVVTLKVLNLSSEDRNLMLLMAKDEQPSSGPNNGGGVGNSYSGRGSMGSRSRSMTHAVNTAVVSEVNGYTFGVWGLSGEDDGTTRQNRDHELLAVDAALLLGEVKGQHSIEAELRFVPLREGTLDVPNLKLYDKTHGKWYNCIHCLKIVAEAV